MHQDYSEGAVADELEKLSANSEEILGERIVRRCIKNRHWGILEHPSITLNVIGFPHSVMVQARTHRVGVSFDCQSQRYTCERILKLADLVNQKSALKEKNNILESLESSQTAIENIFYFRPTGYYQDREGNRYEYANNQRNKDIASRW